MSLLPPLGQPLTKDHIALLRSLAKRCRNSIVQMVTNAQSGHPGGACSVIDYLVLLYAGIISQTGEDVVISNGHVSSAVYSVLAELGVIPREEVITKFRQAGSMYEGHIARSVPGVVYGTGPLGVGASVASALALAEKTQATDRKVFLSMGDGECQEGQVYEMLHFAAKYKLHNLICFVDDNGVQLSGSLPSTMPIDLQKTFAAAGWRVLRTNGHSYPQMWKALASAYQSNLPTVLLAKTIMGKGVKFMESAGKAQQATWHGTAPSREQAEQALSQELHLTKKEEALLDTFRSQISWHPERNDTPADLSVVPTIVTGTPRILPAGTMSDCRSAYGKALVDMARLNSAVIALTADLSASVKTDLLAKEIPERHIEVGIAEQHLVSCAGGLSLKGYVPFASTFGAFMTSRAKDQARVNDINRTNVKMVATHCGLSVGEDGPTHQAIDDMGSMLGLLHTHILEPADANQTDHIVRYIAAHYGNFYVRMGRHKLPIILREDGTPFYDEHYRFAYGQADVLRYGNDITLIASGSLVNTALEVARRVQGSIEAEVIAVSSLKKLDTRTLLTSLRKTGRVITLEDHTPWHGLGSQINTLIAQAGLRVQLQNLGVREYQGSGTCETLYDLVGLSPTAILQTCTTMMGSETPAVTLSPATSLPHA